MRRVYLHTFGCKANQYDTEVIRQALEKAGAAPVQTPALADSAVVNSCAVTHVSVAKLRGLVRRIGREYPGCSSILVIGCAATLDDGTIREMSGVTSVIGGTNPEVVLEALGLPMQHTDRVLRKFSRGSRAWLKIQEGCDEHCTYCATRFARGVSQSRLPEEVVYEAEQLAETHSEIVLTGVNIGSYGHDVGKIRCLSDLVVLLVERIPSVRFRLSSVESTQIDDALVDLMVSAPARLAPHIHAPFQSGSDRILKLMGRRWYAATDYSASIERVSSRVAALGLGADVIVGFPGETDNDFAATRSLVESLPFTYLHVFPYSPRPNTAALRLGPRVSPDVVRRRSKELRVIVAQKREWYLKARNGQECDVVLLDRAGGNFRGLTEDYLSVSATATETLHSRFGATLELRDGSLWVLTHVD